MTPREKKNASSRASYERGKFMRPELRDRRGKKHGWFGSAELAAFNNAKQRCQNPNHPKYLRYGARGICVLFRDFVDFLKDIGPKPEGTVLGRKDSDGHYEPGNVQWVAPSRRFRRLKISRVDPYPLRTKERLRRSRHLPTLAQLENFKPQSNDDPANE
jgi:hypothetical protein